MNAPLLTSNCPTLRLLSRGKVRDLYDIDASTLLFVASDRLSAFDVVMNNGVPAKGRILTQLSVFWFDLLKDILPNHLITADMDAMPAEVQVYRNQLEGRCLLVKKLKMLPLEAIVRGYISGSGWKEYQRSGTVCGIPLPEGLLENASLPKPLFTPSTKAEHGEHDENIHPDKAADLLGADLARQVTDAAAATYAKSRGIILADTKFEFGVDDQGVLHIADEVLTPDSSRFWPADTYSPGRPQNSFDKQYVRDYLTSIEFDKSTSITLPEDVVQKTLDKYLAVQFILTGSELVEK